MTRDPAAEHPMDESENVATLAHDYDVVIFEGPSVGDSSKRHSSRPGLVAQMFALVDFTICIVFIVEGRLTALFVIGAIFSAQFFVLVTRVMRFTGPTLQDHNVQARVSLILKELCIGAKCEVPRVTLKRMVTPVGIMARRGYVTLVVSPDFLEAVDDRALRATLAHEVTHLKRGDVEATRQRARLISLGPYLLGLLAVWKFGNDSWTAFAALFVLILPFIRIVSLIFGYQNRPREIRADLEGAAAVDDPEGMIRGLQVAHELTARIRLRFYSRWEWKWTLFPWSLRARSYPPLESRIAQLSTIEATDSGECQVAHWASSDPGHARVMTLRKRVAHAIVILAVLIAFALLLSSHSGSSNTAPDSSVTAATFSGGGWTFVPMPTDRGLSLTPRSAESIAVKLHGLAELKNVRMRAIAVTVTSTPGGGVSAYPAYLVTFSGQQLREGDGSKSRLSAYAVVVNAVSGEVTNQYYICKFSSC